MTSRVNLKSDNGGDTYVVDKITVGSRLSFDEIYSNTKNASEIDIITYSLSDKGLDLIFDLVNNGKSVNLILNPHFKGFENISNRIKKFNLKELKVYKNLRVHSKCIIADPNFVYTGSQNLLESTALENTALFNDRIIYDLYKNAFNSILNGKHPYNIKPQNKTFISKNYSSRKQCFRYLKPVSTSDTEVKFTCNGMVNWNQKFNGYHNRKITICTFTIPNFDYANKIVKKLFAQGNDVQIIANDISENDLKALRREYPNLKAYVHPNIHAKFVLVGGKNKIIWSSSQNFGSSTWIEDTINIKAKDNTIYDFYKKQLCEFTLTEVLL